MRRRFCGEKSQTHSRETTDTIQCAKKSDVHHNQESEGKTRHQRHDSNGILDKKHEIWLRCRSKNTDHSNTRMKHANTPRKQPTREKRNLERPKNPTQKNMHVQLSGTYTPYEVATLPKRATRQSNRCASKKTKSTNTIHKEKMQSIISQKIL